MIAHVRAEAGGSSRCLTNWKHWLDEHGEVGPLGRASVPRPERHPTAQLARAQRSKSPLSKGRIGE